MTTTVRIAHRGGELGPPVAVSAAQFSWLLWADADMRHITVDTRSRLLSFVETGAVGARMAFGQYNRHQQHWCVGCYCSTNGTPIQDLVPAVEVQILERR